MAEVWVVNASPFIVLAKIQHLDLLADADAAPLIARLRSVGLYLQADIVREALAAIGEDY